MVWGTPPSTHSGPTQARRRVPKIIKKSIKKKHPQNLQKSAPSLQNDPQMASKMEPWEPRKSILEWICSKYGFWYPSHTKTYFLKVQGLQNRALDPSKIDQKTFMKKDIEKITKKLNFHSKSLILGLPFRRDGPSKIELFSSWLPLGSPGWLKTLKNHPKASKMIPPGCPKAPKWSLQIQKKLSKTMPMATQSQSKS